MSRQAGSAEKVIAAMKQPFNLIAEQKRMPDVEDTSFWTQLEVCYPYTLLSTEKMYDLYQATKYIAQRKVPGDIVECGVFLGGAVMLAAGTLAELGITDKDIYLYDTFAGFTGDVAEDDVNIKGQPIGQQQLQSFLEVTRRNLQQVGYPESRYCFKEGDVQQTLLADIPDQISLLRLDTDTYATTLCELERLYPKLVLGGVLIIDDYGYSQGVRRATDEYFANPDSTLFFQRPNYSARSAIKI